MAIFTTEFCNAKLDYVFSLVPSVARLLRPATFVAGIFLQGNKYDQRYFI